MKKYIICSLLFAAALTITSCSEDELSSTSVIKTTQLEPTELDKWLERNYVAPYNIGVKYRYEYNETDKYYYTIPPTYEAAVAMAHIVKYTAIEAYNEVADVNFTRKYFPKQFYFEGEWHWLSNGSGKVLGEAEGGKKIFLMGLNSLYDYMGSVDQLNETYLKTIHHEFCHILNQTIDYPTAFKQVTPSGYVSDKWMDSPYNEGYLPRGFITDYSQQSHIEDFAEMMSTYVTVTAEKWEEYMQEASYEIVTDTVYNADGTPQYNLNGNVQTTQRTVPAKGREYIEQKLDVVRSYMTETWNIDIDELRESILRREEDIVAGKIDLTDTTID